MRIEQYLSAVETYLQPLPTSVREGEIREMVGHLEQLHADFVASGHSDEVAQEMALARFSGARKTGLKLRDVWEGNRGALICLMAVAWYNLVFQIVNVVAGFRLILWVGATTFTEPTVGAAILPAAQAWFLWSLFLMPFGLNFVLGRWGGRRVLLSVPLAYLSLQPWLRTLDFTNVGATTVGGLKLGVPDLMLFVAMIATAGAWAGSFWQRRQRWALIGGASPENASTRLHDYQRGHWRRFFLRASTCVVVVGVIGFAGFSIVKKRMNHVLHPPTPAAAVRVLLSDPGMNLGDMEAATEVSTRVLVATLEELKKSERRVSYTATMHASEAYRKKRIAFLQKNLRQALAGRTDVYDAESCRAALARLKPQGFKISRVVRVTKTAQGWKVEDNARSTAYAWLYDVYYNR